MPSRRASAGEASRTGSVEQELSGVGMIGAVQRLDERRFAGAILSEHHVHLARVGGERHIVQRLNAGEGLRDVACFENGNGRTRERRHGGRIVARLAQADDCHSRFLEPQRSPRTQRIRRTVLAHGVTRQAATSTSGHTAWLVRDIFGPRRHKGTKTAPAQKRLLVFSCVLQLSDRHRHAVHRAKTLGFSRGRRLSVVLPNHRQSRPTSRRPRTPAARCPGMPPAVW